MNDSSECTFPSIPQRAGRALDLDWWVRKGSDWLDGRRAGRTLASLFRMRARRCGDLAEVRNRRLSRILRFAGRHCTYYQELFRSSGFDPASLDGFESLPLLDRATVKSRIKDLMPDCIGRVDFTAKCTGGSTSQPLEFPLARAAQYMDHAHYEYTYRLLGWEPGEPIAAFAGPVVSEQERVNNVFWRVVPGDRDLPYGRVFYSQLYLDDRTAPYYLDHISRLRPVILRGYPSLICRLAEYIIADRTRPPFELKGIQLNSEVAYDWQLKYIKEAFQAPIVLQYGQSEAGVFAYTEADEHQYVCSPFFGLAEVLDAEGCRVKAGETGELVVTGFHNYALPFIRYRTGDLATYDGDDQGVVRIASIEGRQQDYLRTTDGRKVMLTGLVNVKAFCRVWRWQIVQDVPDKVSVLIVKDKGFSDADARDIKNAFRELYSVEAEIRLVDQIPFTTSGKLRLLVQNLNE